jgi:hypothetical protein
MLERARANAFMVPLFRKQVNSPFPVDNWFGGLVFAPFALIFGVFTIGCALFKPSWLAAKRTQFQKRP